MHKLSKEINKWDNIDYFQHMIAYAGMSPPLIPSDLTECNGLRFEQANVLEKLGNKYNKSKWIKASNLFRSSGELIIELCGYASNLEKIRCSEIITEIADLEEKAYQIILNANG